MTPLSTSYGVRPLATGAELRVNASEAGPVTVEVLSGRIEAEGWGGHAMPELATAPIAARACSSNSAPRICGSVPTAGQGCRQGAVEWITEAFSHPPPMRPGSPALPDGLGQQVRFRT